MMIKNEDKLITILTPSFNRAYAIRKLYNSLIKQSSKDFCWLVIDDGSTDNTKDIISEFINDDKIDIKYVYQENGGKHRALNNGIKSIYTEMTFIVDSDDWLTSDAVEQIVKYHQKYKNNKEICGYSFHRCYPDGKINGPLYKNNEYISNYIQCRLNERIIGDKAEVYYTRCLKEFPFLEVNGEKFLVESYVWAQMAMKYNTVYINKSIYIGDYLNDGLTKNRYINKYKSPIGMIEKSKVLCNYKSNLIVKSKAIILYIAYSLVARRTFRQQLIEINYKILFLILYLLGIIQYIRIKFQINKE